MAKKKAVAFDEAGLADLVSQLKANRARLFEAMRKIHDIYLDTQPAEKVA